MCGCVEHGEVGVYAFVHLPFMSIPIIIYVIVNKIFIVDHGVVVVVFLVWAVQSQWVNRAHVMREP